MNANKPQRDHVCKGSSVILVGLAIICRIVTLVPSTAYLPLLTPKMASPFFVLW